MSTKTTTTTTPPQTLATLLTDYDLHHSQPSTSPPTSHPQTSTPETWPTTHRRIPPYRPINTHLDQSTRRVYQNSIERAFIGVMFSGVFLEATASKIWRQTFGRVWDVGYRVGGEW